MVFADISRKQAFFTHLLVSMTIFFVLLYFIAFQWFPSFYYQLDNGYVGTAMIFFVDVVLGPGLTLMIFKPGKKNLKFDMAIILILQLVALSWGVKSVYQDRPALTVFYYGKFTPLSQSGIKNVDMESIEKGLSGDQKLAFLNAPDTLHERRKFWMKALTNNSSEIYYYGPEFEPVDENNAKRMAAYELDLVELKKKNPDAVEALTAYIQTHPGHRESYYLYPINGRFKYGIAVFDIESLRISEVLDINVKIRAKKPEINS